MPGCRAVKMREFVCVGGPVDGKVVQLAEGNSTHQVIESPPIQGYTAILPPPLAPCTVHRYYLMYLGFDKNGVNFGVLAWEGLMREREGVLQKLVRNYRVLA